MSYDGTFSPLPPSTSSSHRPHKIPVAGSRVPADSPEGLSAGDGDPPGGDRSEGIVDGPAEKRVVAALSAQALFAECHLAAHLMQRVRELAAAVPPDLPWEAGREAIVAQLDYEMAHAEAFLEPYVSREIEIALETIAEIHNGQRSTPELTAFASEQARGGTPRLPMPDGWAAPVEEFWRELLGRIGEPDLSDAVLLEMLERAAARIPELIEQMDVEGLAEMFEAGMGQAAVLAALRNAERGTRNAERKNASTPSTPSTFSTDSTGAEAPSVAFAPMAEAVAKLGRKTPVGSKLSSAEWARVPLALRERAQFSARVESVKFLATVQDKLQKRLGLEREKVAHGEAFVNRDSFIRDMRRLVEEDGIQTTDAAGRGTVRDIHSVPRLGLIWDQQTNSAAGYTRWKMDHDADVLDEFPAYRLGESTAEHPRTEAFWNARWAEAGAAVGWEGALAAPKVALKTSGIWMELSIFGTPWPPFDYGSTRELEDVDRAQAEALGLLTKDAPVPEFAGGSGEEGFNDALEASVTDWRPDQISTMELAFGDQVKHEGGKLTWQGNLIADMYDRATTEPGYKHNLDLGTATPRAINLAAAHSEDVHGYMLQMKADDIRHSENRHGKRSGDRQPIGRLEVEQVPHVWRDPDTITRGDDGALLFKKRIDGRLVFVEFTRSAKHKRAGIKTIRREA